MSRTIRRLGSLPASAPSAALALAVAACGSAPAARVAPPVASPVASAAPQGPVREQPPPPLEAKPSAFPSVAQSVLPSGLRVSIVESRALPIVELRVVVRAGLGSGPAGVSELTATLLKEGGTRRYGSSEVLRRIETLGSSLDVTVGRDATTLSMGVLRGQLDEALDLLAEIVLAPRFAPDQLTRVKAKMMDEARDDARSSGAWSAGHILFRTLYPAASPYATSSALPSEIAKVDGAAVHDFYARTYVPSNAEVVLAGDVDAAGAAAAIRRAFGAWKATGARAPAPVVFPQPTSPPATRLIVADRPQSVQSDVFVVELAPELHSPAWPADRVAMQVFGGGLTGRLFEDVREKRSLAYAASAHPIELAHDAQPILAYAGTRAPETADAVQAVLDDLAGMRASPPTDDEVAEARSYLDGIFAVRMETLGAIADMVAQLDELDLPDGYWDTYRGALRAVTTDAADREAAKMFSTDHLLIIVAADANLVAPTLTRFGEVTVVDPEQDFRVLRTLPKGGSPLTDAGKDLR